MRDVTRLRRSALRWAESLLKCRYFVRPPAMVAAGLRRRLLSSVGRCAVWCIPIRVRMVWSVSKMSPREVLPEVQALACNVKQQYLSQCRLPPPAKPSSQVKSSPRRSRFGSCARGRDQPHINTTTNNINPTAKPHSPCRRAETTWASHPASCDSPSQTPPKPGQRKLTQPSQLGGFTLTTTILYLSLNLHARNRLHQSALLHQQAVLLNGIVEPETTQKPQPIDREVRIGLLETAKDRWNAELEKNVRTLQTADWTAARVRLEEKVSVLWRTAFEKTREGVKEVEKRTG